MEMHELFADFLQTLLTPSPSFHLPCCKILQCFDAKKVPDISISEFLERFAVYLKTEPSTFAAAYILIDRLIKRTPGSQLTPLNVHRLLVTSITITEKAFNDFYWRNADYAIVGAITNEELNLLESEFLKGIEYDLRVERETYERVLARISGIKEVSSSLKEAYTTSSIL
eukprot:TRINITY_DN7915_c0_g2_i7.p1 TRINITY_DN7915_c0_g2~~TRINITY_DN7915_c0_g2_i7.p1  ORF type:complete len:170 (-),score=28.18 TRINITY_DN7915_c0_g2_i7:3-512(-)